MTVNAKKPVPTEGAAAEDNAHAGPSRSFVLHRQQALTKDAGSALDMARAKKHKAPSRKKVDELAREDSISLDSRIVLQNLARSFIENCFNSECTSLPFMPQR